MAVAYRNRRERLRLERGAGVARAYDTWVHMRRRCRNPHKNPKDACYAGVSVCAEWDDFDTFFADMGEPPEGMSIDRIDARGDYEPNNCRWADDTAQSRNRSYVKMSESDAVDVRWLYSQGLSQQKIADAFDVSQVLVSKIVRMVNWI